MTFGYSLKEGGRELCGHWEKNVPGRGNSQYKDPEVGTCPLCLGDSAEAPVLELSEQGVE